MIFAGILAGGSGTRMNKSIPKQFLKISDKPIIIRTLNTFLGIERIDKVIVAINNSWYQYCLKLFEEYGIDTEKVILTDGGDTRFDSLVNIALKAKEISNLNEDILISHDCARPFVSERIILDNIEKVKYYDAITTSVPTIDTVLISKDGKTSDDVPIRSNIFLDQGPQTFKVHKFLSIFKELSSEKKNTYMEIGKLFLDNKLKVGIVEGDRKNFKVTTEIDLKYSEFLLKEGYVK